MKTWIGCIMIAALPGICFFCLPLKKGRLPAAAGYALVAHWPSLPQGFVLGNPAGIGIDAQEHIIVFHRAGRNWGWTGAMPHQPVPEKTILIIDKDSGKMIDSWGDHLFIMPHGLTVDDADNIWVTDIGLHQVFKFSHGGKLLMRLGEAGVAGKDSAHFNRPTAVAIAHDGSCYVSDGYGNSRVVKFSATGKYLLEWGIKGSGIARFDIPHGISLDNNGNVYVADRENARIQVFDSMGRFIKQWTNNTRDAVCAVYFDKIRSKLFAADDSRFLKIKHLGSDIFILDTAGRELARFSGNAGNGGHTAWYHAVVADKAENIYVGDILGNTLQKFTKINRP